MSGYPIICLHGLADNCYSFMPISPLLSQKHMKGFSLEMLVARYVEAMKGTIKPESVQVLMKRGAKPAPNGQGFIFSYDLRMVRA